MDTILLLTPLKAGHFKHISNLFFSKFDKNNVFKEIKNLETNKAVQDTDVPSEVSEKNANYFAEKICLKPNYGIPALKFPAPFKFKNVRVKQKDHYRQINILTIIAKKYLKFDLQKVFKSL